MRINSKPIIREFKLITDPDKEAVVGVRQATTLENIELEAKKTPLEWSQRDEGFFARQSMRENEEIMWKAYYTLAYVSNVKDENDQEYFRSKDGDRGQSIKSAMTPQEFRLAWGQLPMDMTKEINRYVHEINPHFDENLGN